ncbi:aminopeptidase [soil metagenome]
MHDPRIDQLARQLVRYSTKTRRGDNVFIDIYDAPDAAAISLIRAVRDAGATPFVQINTSAISREMLMGATAGQYDLIGKFSLSQMKHMDVYIAVRGSHNIAESSDVPADKMKLVMERMRPSLNQRVSKTRWCVLRWPTPSMAQQASLSTEAFEDFFFEVCLLDYQALLPGMRALKRMMDKAKDVHIKGPGTDLRFSIDGIPSIVCGGNYNIPDGEVFTAPVRDSVEGTVSYNAPTIYRGIPFDSIVLEFRKGRIVTASSNNTPALKKILDSDTGARFVGEFAIGFNPRIRQPMRDILFDEKIAGSFHFTPGQAYDEADNGNRSQVHWDMVCIQRPEYGGGEIYFDGKLVRKDGQFLAKSLAPLN